MRAELKSRLAWGYRVRFTAIVSKEPGSDYDARFPDLPECVSSGGTFAELQCNARDALARHLTGLRANGLPIPPPTPLDSVEAGKAVALMVVEVPD